MKYIQKKAWLIWGMILLALLLNVLIISVSNKNRYLLWMLIASIPLLLIAIYFRWQTGHLLQRYFADSLQSPAQPSQFQFLSHSVYPTKVAVTDLNVQIGNDQCSQPYNACIFNIGSMEDTDMGNTFIHSTKEKEPEYSQYSVSEGLNTYHLAAGGLLWQIGPDYIGCRAQDDNFDSKEFKKNARRPEVKMIELKLSSAIKPIQPVDSSLDIVQPIDRKIDNSIFPGSAYTTFREAEGMIYFLHSLRDLSGGKPIGIRLCINDRKEFYQICYAIRKTQIIPDFIVVEGSFESTSIVHTDQAFHIGIPLYEALLFVSQTLQVYSLEKEIKIIASGRIISCFDILKVLALGANVVYTEMPGYSTIKSSGNGRRVSLFDKSQNMYDFHNSLMKATVQAMNVCGFISVSDITLSKFFRRLDVLHGKSFEELKSSVLYPGTLKKIYNSQIKTYQIQEGGRKESIV